jgi:hypothetical protein
LVKIKDLLPDIFSILKVLSRICGREIIRKNGIICLNLDKKLRKVYYFSSVFKLFFSNETIFNKLEKLLFKPGIGKQIKNP